MIWPKYVASLCLLLPTWDNIADCDIFTPDFDMSATSNDPVLKNFIMEPVMIIAVSWTIAFNGDIEDVIGRSAFNDAFKGTIEEVILRSMPIVSFNGTIDDVTILCKSKDAV